jgi:hypothetical protein
MSKEVGVGSIKIAARESLKAKIIFWIEKYIWMRHNYLLIIKYNI